jgi:Glycogen recognition site of AMP-activated protein kinase
LEALPFARLSSGDGFVEARGGWRGHSLSFAGVRGNRAVFEAGGRGGYGTNLRVAGDARWVHASEGTYPFVGASLAYDVAHISVWGRVGKWLDTDLDDGVWGLGSGVSLGPLTTLWGSLRQDATDPLYWNVPRRTWSIGLTRRLTRTRVSLAPVAALASGDIVVSLPAGDAPPGAVSIAGDFNQWQPAPMQREGEFWVVRLTLPPGVYHYTFRSASGDWFVPMSTAGRRSDGMGGFVAVLVVS